MTRPVWIWTESSGTQLNEEPRVRATQFGDGYKQRQADGLNPLAQEWQMRLTGVEDVIADEIIAFLRGCGGVTAFEYTPLWHTTPLLFTCKKWTRTAADTPGFSDIAATFTQEFEP